MKYKAIFFDLDGTLTNPEEGILNSIQYATDYYEIPTVRENLKKYIGPPLIDTFSELISEEKAADAILKYRERFSECGGMFENKIYSGVNCTLQELKKRGYILCTASSKPWIFVDKILEYFDIKKYFDFIGGATLDGKVNKKEDVINAVLKQTRLLPTEVIMVGDRKFDLIGAEAFGMDAIGVLYGFGNREELEKYKNIALIEDIKELLNILVEEKMVSNE